MITAINASSELGLHLGKASKSGLRVFFKWQNRNEKVLTTLNADNQIVKTVRQNNQLGETLVTNFNPHNSNVTSRIQIIKSPDRDSFTSTKAFYCDENQFMPYSISQKHFSKGNDNEWQQREVINAKIF